MKTWIFPAMLVSFLVPLLFYGCAADELTGLEPTPTPSGTPATATPTSGPGTPTVPPGTATPTVPPGTATPTPTRTPVATPTPEPGSRYFQGPCFNSETQQEAGYIAFNVYEDGQVSGMIYLEFMCSSSEPPYNYMSSFDTTFTTSLQGDALSWDWWSPSPAYNQQITISGVVGETEAQGNWTYYFNLNSHQVTAHCEGAGTWTAGSQ